MFNIYKTVYGALALSSSLVAQSESFEGAIEKANEIFDIYCLEIDEDYEECADFLTADGIVGSIQIEGFEV